MDLTLSAVRSRYALLAMLALQFIACLLILFDVPVGRQIVGFAYFTVVPGYLIVKLLKLDGNSRVETAVFSVGFSVALLMIGGLLLNEFGTLLGVARPLSLLPVMTFLNLFILASEVAVFARSRGVRPWKTENLKLRSSILLLGLPVLSITGAISVTFFGNNLILLIMIPVICLVFAIGVFYSRGLRKIYPFAVLMITVALLLHSSLISEYLVNFGSDISLEYVISELTVKNERWIMSGIVGFGRFDPMLSITILPSIYHTMLNIDLTLLYKTVFPLIFALVPLGLYVLWQKRVGSKAAFIAAFLLMAQETFYTEMVGLGRQMIGELFFVLVLLVVLSVKMETYKRVICFVIFSTALVMSHYSLSIFFLIFITATFVFLRVRKRPSRKITASVVLIFFVIMFTWYIYISNASAFYDILSYGQYVYDQLGDFFKPRIFNAPIFESAPTIWNAISRGFAYLTQFLIVLGFFGLLRRKASGNFEREYTFFTVISIVFLAATIIVPGLANTFNITRFYHILLFFLAPLLVLGAEILIKLIASARRFDFLKLVTARRIEFAVSTLIVVVLIPYFLFQTSFVYEVTGNQSWSIPLSSYRMDPIQLYHSSGYINKLCVVGAQWVGQNMNVSMTQMYGDIPSSFPLETYGTVRPGHIIAVSNVTHPFVEQFPAPNETIARAVFLGPLAVIYEKVVYRYWANNLSELVFLEDMNKLYANGGSEVYRK